MVKVIDKKGNKHILPYHISDRYIINVIDGVYEIWDRDTKTAYKIPEGITHPVDIRRYCSDLNRDQLLYEKAIDDYRFGGE